MGVEEYQLLPVTLFLQYGPGSNTVVGGVPAFDADSFGLFTKREITVFHQCEPVAVEEYRAIFACFLAIVTSYA